MIKVECPGCKAPYHVDERRVPDAGLKMRCPKCATSTAVMKPGTGAAAKVAARKSVAPPAASAPAAQRPSAPAAEPPRSDSKDLSFDSDWDLPAPGGRTAAAGAPPPAQKRPIQAAAGSPFDAAI